ncbi:MAG: hypothetical protein V1870_01065, partial [Candidatus Aenigmatarchaeota archaeon]
CAGSCVIEPILNDTLAVNGTLVTSGIPNKKELMHFDVNDYMRKLVIGNRAVVGVINTSLKPHFEKAVEHLKQMESATDIITHRYSPKDCVEAYDTFQTDPNRIKIIFEF